MSIVEERKTQMLALQKAVERAMRRFKLPVNSIHGPRHWSNVERVGALLADSTPGADPLVVKTFALLHDCCRENEDYDPQHGPRAAELCSKLPMNRNQRDLLCHAVALHTDGLTSDNPTIGVCWDADRLDLTRVGVRPVAALMSTQAARAQCSGCQGVWYHLTPDFHGVELRAHRRAPLSRCSSEPDEPRVCVSSTASGCFTALEPFSGPGYLYRYEGLALDPIGVWDSSMTGEKWVPPPATLALVQTIPPGIVARIYAPTLARGKLPQRGLVRVAQRVHAARLLGDDPFAETLWREFIAPHAAEEFIRAPWKCFQNGPPFPS